MWKNKKNLNKVKNIMYVYIIKNKLKKIPY